MQSEDIKTVGIIGAGRIGKTMARIARRAGRSVVIANSRGPASLSSVVEELGEGVTAEDHARWCGTIPYEILCGIRAERRLI